MHTIIAVALVSSYEPCSSCAPERPHNVIALCECGQRATGKSDHIWTITRREGEFVWLSPSFNWLIDPRDPSKGSHLHENVQGVSASKQGDWPLRVTGAGS